MIKWNEEEVERITRHFYELKAERPSASDLSLIRQAQRTALPLHRQRSIVSRADVAPTIRYILAHPHIVPERKPPPPSELNLETALGKIAEQFATILVERLGTDIDRIVRRAVEETLSEPVSAQEVADEISRVTGTRQRKKVTIIGLLPNQEEMVKVDFGKVLDLNFFKTARSAGKALRERVKNADFVIGMKRFINHTDELIAKRETKGKYIGIPGGMTSLRDILEDIALGTEV